MVFINTEPPSPTSSSYSSSYDSSSCPSPASSSSEFSISPSSSSEFSSFTSLIRKLKTTHPAREHPDTDRIIASTTKRLLKHWPFPDHASREHFQRADTPLWFCLCFPDALPDRVDTGATIPTTLFELDDLLETWSSAQVHSFGKQIKAALSGAGTKDRDANPPAPSYSPEIVFVLTLFQEMSSVPDADGAILGREFAQLCYRWMQETLSPERKKAREDDVKFDEYVEFRVMDAGYWLTLGILRWCINLRLPQKLASHPLLQEVEKYCGNQAAIVNDLFSYVKEVKAEKAASQDALGGKLMNAVAMIRREQGVDDLDAAMWLMDWVREEERKFEDAAAKLEKEEWTEEERTAMTKYTNALRALMAGNLEWSKVCGRYNSVLEV